MILKKIIKFKKTLNNIKSSQNLNVLLNKGCYLPITESSLDIFVLNLIVNDTVINKRENIIEFGSGISTILLARLANQNNLNLKIYSVDNDINWLNIIKNIIKQENLERFVIFIHAPLVKNKNTKSLENLNWYDENIIEQEIKDIKFDCVIVDGPYANSKKNMLSRYPAFPFVLNKLNKKYSFFLDDVNRKGENIILKKWNYEYGIKFKIINKQSAHYISGDSFNFI